MFVDTREQHISLFRSSHQETPGLEHELTEIKRLRVEAYCTKQPKLFSFQFHGTHPDNACINRISPDASLPSFAAIRLQRMKCSLEP